MVTMNRWRGLRRILIGAVLVAGLLLAAGSLAVAWLQFRPPQDALTFPDRSAPAIADALDWTNVGGTAAHTRYTPLAQLTPRNVGYLQPAWTYRTGEAARHPDRIRRSKFQATPILAEGRLVFCTPFNRVIALDPRSGREAWMFDAAIDTRKAPANDFNCRGVAQWRDGETAPDGKACASRIFTATNDRRLIALDARTGRRCPGFGSGGEVEVIPLADPADAREIQIVAAPAVAGNVVIVGSSIADNQRAAARHGIVHAFDARTGRRVWQFDPLANDRGRTGGGNVWSSISVDAERGLVYLPTSSPSPDFFGGTRGGNSALANAIVAVRARDGVPVWSFQTVRHDLWDYDVPAAPALFELRRGGRTIPALAFATKAGFIYILDRTTGRPLFPVAERRVPASDVPGERVAATQPHSLLPAIAPQRIRAEDAFGVLGFDTAACARQLREARNEGVFTPPSLRGTVYAPTTGGGANWGGVTIDPVSNRLFVNTNRAAELIRLVPRAESEATGRGKGQPQNGTPYAATRGVIVSPLGLPCNPPPWGALTALDLGTGRIAWESPLGTTSTLAPFGIALRWGTPNLGGSIATAGGLLFIGAAMDNRLRAFDSATGAELWAADLPAGAQATPMSYAIGGRQFVVVAAGGHSVLGTTRGDYLMAFALPEARIRQP